MNTKNVVNNEINDKLNNVDDCQIILYLNLSNNIFLFLFMDCCKVNNKSGKKCIRKNDNKEFTFSD